MPNKALLNLDRRARLHHATVPLLWRLLYPEYLVALCQLRLSRTLWFVGFLDYECELWFTGSSQFTVGTRSRFLVSITLGSRSPVQQGLFDRLWQWQFDFARV
jgi:hypothetical protein